MMIFLGEVFEVVDNRQEPQPRNIKSPEPLFTWVKAILKTLLKYMDLCFFKLSI